MSPGTYAGTPKYISSVSRLAGRALGLNEIPRIHMLLRNDCRPVRFPFLLDIVLAPSLLSPPPLQSPLFLAEGNDRARSVCLYMFSRHLGRGPSGSEEH